MPVRKMPSKVPAPPIEATGAPRPPHLVEVGEVGADQRAEAAGDIGERRGFSRDSTKATMAVTSAGKNTGTAMPRPGTG